MLEAICAHIHNYFTAPEDILRGAFTVEGGAIELPTLLPGQYFRIVGSALNEGVYRYPVDPEAQALADETFTGEIWPMRVPRRLLQLAAEIADWQAKYGAAMASPYQTETLTGVYSYTKQGGRTSQGQSGDADGWKIIYKSRLDEWRKLR